MSHFDLLVIAPLSLIPAGGSPRALETPYGAVQARLLPCGPRLAAWAGAECSAFAAIYAAKAAGAARVVELAPCAARNRLLEPGDLLLPDDLVDRTRLARYTFFAGKGYGFLAQREPFCPALRAALLAASARRARRVFARGVYLAAAEPATEAESIWQADIVGRGVVPASFLARELELCYAPLCLVAAPPEDAGTASHGPTPAVGWLADALAEALRDLPAGRACICATAMQQYRDRGDIGEDWRTWVAP
jgi:5'-methylthioadenosine phosphorylase